MRNPSFAELQAALEQVLAAQPERLWKIGALYDEVSARLTQNVSLRAVTKAVDKLVSDQRLLVSWQIYGIRNFRLREALA